MKHSRNQNCELGHEIDDFFINNTPWMLISNFYTDHNPNFVNIEFTITFAIWFTIIKIAISDWSSYPTGFSLFLEELLRKSKGNSWIFTEARYKCRKIYLRAYLLIHFLESLRTETARCSRQGKNTAGNITHSLRWFNIVNL